MTKLFIPYIMGNKDLIENATLLSENGADIIEIGVPFTLIRLLMVQLSWKQVNKRLNKASR
ncbi:hypothetical protein ACVPOS_11285 [Staphylococcus aureus]